VTENLKLEVREALSHILSESQVHQGSWPTRSMTHQTAGGNIITMSVPASGDVQITISPAGRANPRHLSGFDDDDLFLAEDCPECCQLPCGDPPGFLGEAAAATYFDQDEEALIGKLTGALGLSREQLLGHLMHHIMSSALERLARRHGIA
jgi:hypothetical protein